MIVQIRKVQRVVSQVLFERTLHQKGSLPQNQLFTLKIRIAQAEFTPRSKPRLALYGFKVGICERRALVVGFLGGWSATRAQSASFPCCRNGDIFD